MDQAALPIIQTLLGFPVHKPAVHRPPSTVRLLPLPLPPPQPPPPPALRPRLEILGQTIQRLFFHHTPPKKSTVKPVVHPPSLVAPPPPPLPLPPLPSQKNPCSILGSIQGLSVPPVHLQSPQPDQPQAHPSQSEISNSIQRLIRHIAPAICRQLALPLAAHVARDSTATAALVLGGAAIAACQRCLQVVPYSNRVQVIFHSPDEYREHDEFEFAHFKNTNASQIFRPRHYQTARVRRLTSKIVGAINRGLAIKGRQGVARVLRPHTRHINDLDWEVIITNDKECNAYVHPSGGKIVLFEGLLQRFETDAEIAAIIAHEVGHVVQRCNAEWASTPSFSRSQALSLSRRLEAEADYIGIMLLAAAGFDPQAALKVCDKFADIERINHYGWFYDDSYSTHPSEKKRKRMLSQPKVMGEALELYNEVTAKQGHGKISPECGILSFAYGEIFPSPDPQPSDQQ